MGGAALSYWEIKLESHEVIAMTNVILGTGQSNKMARREQRFILGLTLFSVLLAAMLVLLAFDTYVRLHDGYRLAVQLFVAIVFAASWPAAYYALTSWRASWSYKQANLLRQQSFEERRATITGWIHRWAFYALYVAGLCQIPLLLS
jgi:hypothetical protein